MHSDALAFDLVVSCTRLGRDPRDAERLRSSVAPNVDWTSVLALAQRHGVTAFVHGALRETAPGALPPAAARVLAHRASRQAARNARRRATLGRVLDAFGARGVDVIPLRCARLHAWAGDLPELDLLVRRPDAATAFRLLADHGFEAETPLGPGASRDTQAAARFVDRPGDVVSLQWDVADRAVSHGPSVEALWRRATTGQLDGRPCLTLERADLLQLACVRGTIGRWQRLLWVREVAETMAEAGPGELDTALARASRAGARRALVLGASLAALLAGAPTTPALAAAFDPALADLERAALRDMAASSRPLAGPTEIARFHLRGRERIRDQVRYAARRVALPRRDETVADGPASQRLLNRALIPWRRALSVRRQWLRGRSPVHGDHLARFVATPPHVVDRMLALARVTAGDRLLDLGCGDGAIVIRAAQRIGCPGTGIDLDPALIEQARRHARAAGVDGLVDLRAGDARETDVSAFTVVCIYLGDAGNVAVRPFLRSGLRPGARVVSFNFDMGDWWADDVETLDETAWGSNVLYLWDLARPARVEWVA